jgi:hypothetical protein
MYGTVLPRLAVLVVVLAQQEVDGMARATSVSCGAVADVVDDDDYYRPLWAKRSCLGGSWCSGAYVGERRGHGVVSVDGTRPCSGVRVGVSVHVIASMAGTGTGWSGSSRASFLRGRVLAGSGE